MAIVLHGSCCSLPHGHSHGTKSCSTGNHSHNNGSLSNGHSHNHSNDNDHNHNGHIPNGHNPTLLSPDSNQYTTSRTHSRHNSFSKLGNKNKDDHRNSVEILRTRDDPLIHRMSIDGGLTR